LASALVRRLLRPMISARSRFVVRARFSTSNERPGMLVYMEAWALGWVLEGSW
jgi:hypothetical protein